MTRPTWLPARSDVRLYRRRLRFACASLTLAMAACQTSVTPERVAFTQGMRTRYDLTEPEIRALQYYVSEPVVLEKVVSRGVRHVEHGRLIVRGDTIVHQVVIARGTPGAIERDESIVGQARDGTLPISFEVGAPLPFTARPPNGHYALLLSGEESPLQEFLALFALGTPSTAYVAFQGTSWRIAAGRDATLLVERDAFGRLARERRRLPGVVLPR